MEEKYFYLTPALAIRTHQKILTISGGWGGVKIYGNIESPLELMKMDDYYPELEDKLTHLVYSLNKNHGFDDGNKRISIAMGAFFLVINGLDMFSAKFIIEMENIAVAVADNLIDKDLLHKIIYSILYEEDFNEQIKLSIYKALSIISTYENVPTFTKEGVEFYYGLF